jgi:hypothetical protein
VKVGLIRGYRGNLDDVVELLRMRMRGWIGWIIRWCLLVEWVENLMLLYALRRG